MPRPAIALNAFSATNNNNCNTNLFVLFLLLGLAPLSHFHAVRALSGERKTNKTINSAAWKFYDIIVTIYIFSLSKRASRCWWCHLFCSWYTEHDAQHSHTHIHTQTDHCLKYTSAFMLWYLFEFQIINVELNRGWNSRLGFSLQTNPNTKQTVISAIYSNSVAAKDGRLRVGDQVLMVSIEHDVWIHCLG